MPLTYVGTPATASNHLTRLADVDTKITAAVGVLATGTATDALYVADTQALTPGRHHVITTAGATTQYAYGGINYTVATISLGNGVRTGQILSAVVTGTPDARITGTFTDSHTDILVTAHDTVFSLEWNGTAWRYAA